VTEQLVRSATAGMKEADANYLNVLTDLFCPMSKKRVKERGMGEADESKYVERLSHALEATGPRIASRWLLRTLRETHR
jgi:chromosome transmission fidelity protein 18